MCILYILLYLKCSGIQGYFDIYWYIHRPEYLFSRLLNFHVTRSMSYGSLVLDAFLTLTLHRTSEFWWLCWIYWKMNNTVWEMSPMQGEKSEDVWRNWEIHCKLKMFQFHINSSFSFSCQTFSSLSLKFYSNCLLNNFASSICTFKSKSAFGGDT